MTEVGGDAAIYIDPDDPAGAAAVIADGLTQRAALVDAGLRNAQRFSTRAMVEGYLQCYAMIARGVAKAPNSFVSESGRDA
jgi:hypothetical protein